MSILYKNINRILLIKLREVGDLLLTVPVITALKEKYPHCNVSMMVNSGTEPVVTNNPLLSKIYIFNRASKNFPLFKKIKEQLKLIWEIRKGNYDMVIDFTGGDRAALCSFFSGARHKIGFEIGSGFLGKKYIYTHRIKSDPKPKHSLEKNFELLQSLDIKSAKKSPDFFFSDEDDAYISEIFKKNNIGKENLLIHVHPTSKWLFKCWKDSYFAKLIDYLIDKYNAKIFLTSGISEKEKNKVKSIIALCQFNPIYIEGKCTLKHLAALSKRCDLFVGIDTGPMHIAASVKTPVVVMFGPSGTIEWAPWGEGHTVVKNNYDCMPCGQDGCNGSKISKCLEDITVDMVTEKVDKVIERISLIKKESLLTTI